jgi:hypothetical protein
MAWSPAAESRALGATISVEAKTALAAITSASEIIRRVGSHVFLPD